MHSILFGLVGLHDIALYVTFGGSIVGKGMALIFGLFDFVLSQLPGGSFGSSRRLFIDNGWPTIDVTRRSIEETAATIPDHAKQKPARVAPGGL